MAGLQKGRRDVFSDTSDFVDEELVYEISALGVVVDDPLSL